MRSSAYVISWTVLFILFGLYINKEAYKFTDRYISDISIVEKHIENNDWDNAKNNLDDISKKWIKEKGVWYKLLNHEYFENVSSNIIILDKNIYTKDKSRALEQIEKIKISLSNIIESEKCDLNHIF